MKTEKLIKKSQFNLRKHYILHYLSSILNIINSYQLPKIVKITLSFKFISKDKFIILAYYVLFKYFFNKCPLIQVIKKKDSKIMYPTKLKLVLFKRNIIKFLLHFFYAYKKENLELNNKIKVLSEYKGQGCFLILHNFFLLGIILDVLLLYKNDGLFLGIYGIIFI